MVTQEGKGDCCREEGGSFMVGGLVVLWLGRGLGEWIIGSKNGIGRMV
jgi:hypothetical protein